MPLGIDNNFKMSEIDFSDYFNRKTTNAISPEKVQQKEKGGRNGLYVAIIITGFIVTVVLLSFLFVPDNRSVEETLPPGVPLEAPGLEALEKIQQTIQ